VDPEESGDYYQMVSDPMDLETVRSRVDSGYYLNLDTFIEDVELIKCNAEDYNGRAFLKSTRGRDVLHSASLMMDTVLSMVYKLKGEVGHVFRRCDKILAEKMLKRDQGQDDAEFCAEPTSTKRARPADLEDSREAIHEAKEAKVGSSNSLADSSSSVLPRNGLLDQTSFLEVLTVIPLCIAFFQLEFFFQAFSFRCNRAAFSDPE
jgi:hypothetical protein